MRQATAARELGKLGGSPPALLPVSPQRGCEVSAWWGIYQRLLLRPFVSKILSHFFLALRARAPRKKYCDSAIEAVLRHAACAKTCLDLRRSRQP